MKENEMHGTTTVGIVCQDGVVLATDSRATMGHMIASINAKKVYRIGGRLAMTIAGSVGDAQQLVKIMSIETKMYKVSREHPMSVKAASNLLANVLRAERYYQYQVQLLLGGYDKTGPRLYSIDAAGGLIEDNNFYSTGSGSPMAYGVLESQYAEGMNCDEGVILVVRALKAAMSRDSASGNTIKVVKITKEEYKEIEDETVNYILEEIT